MFLFTYTAAVLGILCIGTAYFVYLNRGSSKLATHFFWFLIWLAVWIGGNAAADLTTTFEAGRFWSGVCLIGGSFFISVYLSFVEYFISGQKLSRLKLWLFFGPSFLFTLIAFTPLYVLDVIVTPGVPTGMVLGQINFLVLIFTVCSMLYVPYQLIHSFPFVTPIKQKQIFYLIVGYLPLLFGAIFFTIILPFFGEFRFYTLGPQFSSFTIISTAYAIFRHQLLDIRVAIQRSLVYGVLVAGIVVFYLGILFVCLNFFRTFQNIPYLISAIFTTLVGVFSVPVFERKFRAWTDRFFFKERYSFSTAIAELSEIASRYDRIEEILAHAAHALNAILRTDNVCFSLSREYIMAIFRGRKKVEILPFASDCSYLSGKVTSSDYYLSLLVPLIVESQQIGCLRISPKLSGERYESKDFDLLRAFAPLVAVAFKKALLYQAVVDYSFNLSKKVEERTEEIRALQEQQTQLMLDLSHELQTPLTVIKGEIGILYTVSPGPALIIEKSIDRISIFIRALLKLARLEADTDEKETVNFSILVRDIVEYVTVLAAVNHINVLASIEDGIAIKGNEQQLKQLVTNLLSNAIKYIGTGRKITLSLEVLNNTIRLTIIDTGIGIAADQIPQLFKRFYRFNQLKSGGDDVGTGLGLAICKQIARNHKASLTVKSKVGEGTTVIASFPFN